MRKIYTHMYLNIYVNLLTYVKRKKKKKKKEPRATSKVTFCAHDFFFFFGYLKMSSYNFLLRQKMKKLHQSVLRGTMHFG